MVKKFYGNQHTSCGTSAMRGLVFGLLGGVLALAALAGIMLSRIDHLEVQLKQTQDLAILSSQLSVQNSKDLRQVGAAIHVHSANIEKLRSGGETLWNITHSLAQDYQGFRGKVETRFPSIKRMK